MRIGVLGYVGAHKTGIGRYIDEILARWGDRMGDDHTVELFVNPDSPIDSPNLPWVRTHEIPAPAGSSVRNLAWVLLQSKRRYERLGLDVLWLPNFTWVPRVTCPVVSTIHDVIEFRVTGKFDPYRVLYRRRAVPRMARRSAHVLTVSETSRRDIIELFGIAPDKVTAIPNGVSPMFRPAAAAGFNALAERWALRRPYVLYVGTLDHPGKNAATLLKAFAHVRDRLPHGTQLVLAGKPGKGFDNLRAIAKRLDLHEDASNVHWLGFVPDELLPALYAAASAFVFPSLYEGFGLPVVEAFASGVPVITSNVGALREVGAEAAVVVEPFDSDAIGDGLVRLLTDSAFAAERRERGLRRAACYDWKRTAHATLDTLLAHGRTSD